MGYVRAGHEKDEAVDTPHDLLSRRAITGYECRASGSSRRVALAADILSSALLHSSIVITIITCPPPSPRDDAATNTNADSASPGRSKPHAETILRARRRGAAREPAAEVAPDDVLELRDVWQREGVLRLARTRPPRRRRDRCREPESGCEGRGRGGCRCGACGRCVVSVTSIASLA